MARVNIHTKVSSENSPFGIPRVGMWLVEVINGDASDTFYRFSIRESAKAQELTLQMICNALTVTQKLNVEFESIEIYSDCKSVGNAFLNHWFEGWGSKQEWKTAKGEDIADKELWTQVWELQNAQGKRCIFSKEKSSYHDWMGTQIRKEIEKIKDKEAAAAGVEKVREMLK